MLDERDIVAADEWDAGHMGCGEVIILLQNADAKARGGRGFEAYGV